jgi:hypothetical protein
MDDPLAFYTHGCFNHQIFCSAQNEMCTYHQLHPDGALVTSATGQETHFEDDKYTAARVVLLAARNVAFSLPPIPFILRATTRLMVIRDIDPRH